MMWEMHDYRHYSFDPQKLRWPWWAVPKEFFIPYCVEVLWVFPFIVLIGGINLVTVGSFLWLDYYFFFRLKRYFQLSCHFILFTFLMLMGLLLRAVS